ncbi:MAG: DUF2061 domain-containing protein [Nanoarchaeota archaeon]
MAKAMTFRATATALTCGMVYAFTGSLALAGTLGSIDVVSKLVLYYGHERAWERVSWGTKGSKLAEQSDAQAIVRAHQA